MLVKYIRSDLSKLTYKNVCDILRMLDYSLKDFAKKCGLSRSAAKKLITDSDLCQINSIRFLALMYVIDEIICDEETKNGVYDMRIIPVRKLYYEIWFDYKKKGLFDNE